MNGQRGKEFRAGRGLKQGDPLSPLLFILTMEYFSRQLKQAYRQPHYAFHPGCAQLELTHLMFVDDVHIFSKAHPRTIGKIMQVLDDFFQCAGLQVNSGKSHAYYGGCPTSLKDQCQAVSGFKEGSFPIRYLDIPL